MSTPVRNGGLARAAFWLDMLKFVAPAAIAMAVGYGSVKFTMGAWEQRLVNLEVKQIEIQRQLEQNRERYITRDELKVYLDFQTRALDQIQADVRALRGR